jgi:hypothetical protein
MSDFEDALPENYRDAVANAGITDMESLVQNWADGQSTLGNSVRIPGPDAGAEDIAAFDARLVEKVPGLVRLPDFENDDDTGRFYQSLGRPEKAGDYKFNGVEGLAEDEAKNMGEWVSELAFKNNLTAGQAEAFYNDISESTMAARKEAEANRQTTVDALKEDWGNDYDKRLLMAQNVLHVFGGEEGAKLAAEELNTTGMGNNPVLANILHNVALNLNEDQLMEGVDDAALGRTRTELDARIGEIRNNKEHPFNNALHSGHAAALAQMEQLYAERNGLQQAES